MNIVPLGIWAVSTSGETTSFLLENGNISFLIDTGLNPAFHLAQLGKPLTQITDVFLSHCHSDHIAGFANFVFSRQVAERSEGAAPELRVWGLDSVLDVGRQMLALQYPDRSFSVSWRACNPGTEEQEDGFILRFLETAHSVPGLALRITSKDTGKSLCYTSDTSPMGSLAMFCAGADVLLGECFGSAEAFGAVIAAQQHMSATDLAALARESGVRKVVLFHMHAPYATEEGRLQLLGELAVGYGGEIVFPTPLISIEV